MSEIQLTEAEANALHGTTDSDTDFKYHSPGDAGYFTEGQRQRHRMLTIMKAISNALRVYRDGSLTFGVRPGTAGDGEKAYSYAGSVANELSDDATNYIYLDVQSSELRLVCNTTGLPDVSVTPHIPLATIVTADGGYGLDDITDLRAGALFELLSAMTATDANTLVAGSASNADALHIHAAAGLAPALQDLIPTLTVTATDNADGSADISIQVKDAAGNNLAQYSRIRTWVATAEWNSPVAQTGFAVSGNGGTLCEYTANADYDVITDATGLVEMMLVAADGTYYVMAEINGRIYSDSVAITGN